MDRQVVGELKIVLKVLEKAKFDGLSITDMIEVVNTLKVFSTAVKKVEDSFSITPIEEKTKLKGLKK